MDAMNSISKENVKIYCPNCSALLPGAVNYCGMCGKKPVWSKKLKLSNPSTTPWEDDDGKWHCGICAEVILDKDQKYCTDCGKPIDWDAVKI